MQSAFAAHAAFFVSAEGGSGVEFVVGVGPYHAGTQLLVTLKILDPLSVQTPPLNP